MKNTLLNKEADLQPDGGGEFKANPLRHFLHLDFTVDDIAVITFDRPGKAANIFDEATLDELNLALDAIDSLGARGVVFLSAKPSIFIAGADLEALAKAEPEELSVLIEKGQTLFERIAQLPMPTLAAIHGACLGGGLELALACDRRVASDDKATKIGLPETQLGILPAWGGSTRLPRLIGLPKALPLILQGKALGPKQARRLGVVDAVVPKECLEFFARREVVKPLPPRRSFFLTNNRLSAFLIGHFAMRDLLRRTRGNYPAPVEALRVVTRGARGPVRDSLAREHEAVLRLARSPEVTQLMRLFRLQERAGKFRFAPEVDAASLPPVTTTAVIGAGVMGSGIAQWFSARDIPVLLRDLDRERVAAGMESVRRLFDTAVERKILTKHEAMRRLDLVTPSAEPVPLTGIDLVVEAAVENLEIKKKIFADLCARSRPDTILATNTSALPVSALCQAPGVTHPERIVGLHFFNPVSRMKLVEVVVTEETSPEVVDRVLALVRRIGKVPVVVKDSPGFLVNRILMPYLIEAGRLVEAGQFPEIIDEAMLDFGMPMGPVRLLDEVGLDVAAHVAATMREAFGDRFELPGILLRHVKEGRLGRKTGEGFYRYENGKAVRGSSGIAGASATGIAARLAGLMIDEAGRCLVEGIARDADDIDLAMVLGTGFAPFRGGPLALAAMESVKSNSKT